LALRNFRDRLFCIVLLVSVLVYFWGMTFLVLSILRYMVPALGLTIVFAAITIDTLLRRRVSLVTAIRSRPTVVQR